MALIICSECGKEIFGEDAINKHIASETKVNIDGGNIVRNNSQCINTSQANCDNAPANIPMIAVAA